MQKIAAGIVLYNPEIGRLKENISAVAAQCGKVYLLDNGSSNIGEVISMVEGLDCADDITLIKNEKNEGVARALNELSEAAYADGYEWLLTLDHDSVCPANMIEEYEKYMYDKSIGMLCPVVIDLNGGGYVAQPSEEPCAEVNECITSGSLLRLSAWKVVNGFDDFMFIDSVDFDICHRIRKANYRIVKIRDVVMSHELGQITRHRFFWRKISVLNHSAFRKYYLARNAVYLARKEHTSVLIAVLHVVKMLLINLLYEEDKLTKTKRIFKGFVDGFKCPVTAE